MNQMQINKQTTALERISYIIKATGRTEPGALRELSMSENTIRNARLAKSEPSSQLVQGVAGLCGVSTDWIYGRETADGGVAIIVPLSKLQPSPLNPRKTFDMVDIAGLVQSIKARGLLQPLLIAPGADGGYWIKAGERRFRAITMLAEAGDWPRDDPRVRCTLTELSDEAGHLIDALVENLQRADMNPLDEGAAFLALKNMGTQPAKLAAQTGVAESYITQRIALVNKLIGAAKDAMREGKLDFTRARLLVSLTPEHQETILANLDKYPTADAMAREIKGYENLAAGGNAVADLYSTARDKASAERLAADPIVRERQQQGSLDAGFVGAFERDAHATYAAQPEAIRPAAPQEPRKPVVRYLADFGNGWFLEAAPTTPDRVVHLLLIHPESGKRKHYMPTAD